MRTRHKVAISGLALTGLVLTVGACAAPGSGEVSIPEAVPSTLAAPGSGTDSTPEAVPSTRPAPPAEPFHVATKAQAQAKIGKYFDCPLAKYIPDTGFVGPGGWEDFQGDLTWFATTEDQARIYVSADGTRAIIGSETTDHGPLVTIYGQHLAGCQTDPPIFKAPPNPDPSGSPSGTSTLYPTPTP